MDDCVFCKIVKGDIPSYKVYEDNLYLAFLTIRPVKEGHTLVIPKKHDPYLFDLDSIEMANLMNASKKVAEKLKQVFNPKSGKVGVMVSGEDIPHIHIHLIPFDNGSELTFANQKDATSAELQATLERINKI